MHTSSFAPLILVVLAIAAAWFVVTTRQHDAAPVLPPQLWSLPR